MALFAELINRVFFAAILFFNWYSFAWLYPELITVWFQASKSVPVLIPNLALITVKNVITSLQKINDSKTVFFFWDTKSVKHYKEIHVRISDLKTKYPEYAFVGINTGTDFEAWNQTVISSGYNQANEYQLKNSIAAKNTLFINSANKAMIVDKGGVILEGNSNLFKQNFESLLLGYLNKK